MNGLARGGRAPPRDEELALAHKLASSEFSDEEYTRRHRIYARPRRLLAWGEVQTPRHVEPHDLLMDLVQVAACFQIGHFLAHNVHIPVGFMGLSVGVLGLCGFGLTTVSLWSDLLAYRSRFECTSLFHSALDGAQALFFAAAAHNIVPSKELLESRHMHAFVFFVLCTRAISLVRFIEIALVGEGDDKGNSKSSARNLVAHTLLEAASITPAFLMSDVESVCWILIFSAGTQFAWSVVPSLLGRAIPSEKRVPVHVEYTITRTGELIMLALGEIVLSLVLGSSQSSEIFRRSGHGQLDEDSGSGLGPEYEAPMGFSKHHGRHLKITEACGVNGCSAAEMRHAIFGFSLDVELGGYTEGCEPCSVTTRRSLSFTAAFFSISALVYFYNHANPIHRHRHATRRSLTRGIIWSYTHWLLVLAVIGLAASIKELFRDAAVRTPAKAIVLLADSLGSCLLVMGLQHALHPGWSAYVHAAGRIRRLALFTGRMLLCLPLFLVKLVVISRGIEMGPPGYQLLLLASLVTLLSTALLSAEKSNAESDRALWSFADLLLAGKTREEAMAAEQEALNAKLLAASANDGGKYKAARDIVALNPFAKPAPNNGRRAAGCVPCVGKRGQGNGQYGESMSDVQWQRLG